MNNVITCSSLPTFDEISQMNIKPGTVALLYNPGTNKATQYILDRNEHWVLALGPDVYKSVVYCPKCGDHLVNDFRCMTCGSVYKITLTEVTSDERNE